jgi:hypothetical protein
MILQATAALMLLVPSAKRAQPPARLDAAAVLAEFDKMALKDLWPGFDPRDVPVAVYDGKRTLLVHHPKEPGGFVPVKEIAGALAFPGRHHIIRANTSVELEGVQTATVSLDPGRMPTVQKAAALLIHEAFHVFQRNRHPTWSADEGELFTYPFEDDAVLTLRRVETRALFRSLTAKDPPSILCWANEAMETRQLRFSKMPPGAAAYERGTELNEGLANYVEGRALESQEKPLPEVDFPPEAIRQRGYASGRALAQLLDRTDETWRETLEKSTEELFLDDLLRKALVLLKAKVCAVSAKDKEAMGKTAGRDIEALKSKKAKVKADFAKQAGWKLVVEAKEDAFKAAEFDPLNVEVLSKGEVLHRRSLKLTSSLGNVDILNRTALTEAAGSHPLLQGVRRVTVTGLPSAPVVKKSLEGTTLSAPGIQGQIKTAKVTKVKKEVRVILEFSR